MCSSSTTRNGCALLIRSSIQLHSRELTRFTDDELKEVVGLLSGPGVVWKLKFGSWVLLQPGRINAYAQAVIQTMRADEHGRGCLAEVLDNESKDRALVGDVISTLALAFDFKDYGKPFAFRRPW